jgi:hypothetical protein
MKIQDGIKNSKINSVGISSDTLTGRGGLPLIMRYLDKIGIWAIFEDTIGHLRFSGKGKAIGVIVRQIIATFIDGTDSTMEGFDRRRKHAEISAQLECTPDEIIGGSMVRRFFFKFIGSRYRLLRAILHTLFIWRLKITRPTVIKLYIDTMVLDNDQGLCREGCKPTYKKVKGFQPLQVHWGRFIVDMEFRSGEKHSNHGDGVCQSISTLVTLIRKKYSSEVPIIVKCDSGFLSDANFNSFEELGVHYIGMGKLYDYLYDPLQGIDINALPTLTGTSAEWAYYEFGSRFKNEAYTKFRRTIFTTITREGEQAVLRGIRPDSFIHTNIGTNPILDKKLIDAGHQALLQTVEIIRLAHQNGTEELNHRSIKEFMGSEQLPFKRFGMNGAYYSIMVIANFLLEAYRQDVAEEVFPKPCYPTTLRRTLIDFAAKIVRTGGEVILKVTQGVWDEINVWHLWLRCNNPPAIISA